MRNKYVFTAALLAILTMISAAVCMMSREPDEKAASVQVVTSFYPVYIATLNVTDGIPGVEVQCLSQPASGCVHDHQLTTKDMKLLEKADVLIVNGAGMEGYLQSVIERYPGLKVADSSAGIPLLLSEEGGHNHSEEKADGDGHSPSEEEEHIYNAHIWMDMGNYSIQIENIGNALADIDPAHKNQYERNTRAYVDRVKELLEAGRELFGPDVVQAVSTHEAFSYFAQNFQWEIVKTVNMDENTSLKAQELGEVVTVVEEQQIPYVLTEEVYGTSISNVLGEETDCRTLVLDPLVGGERNKDAYLNGMSKNMHVLKEAVGQ